MISYTSFSTFWNPPTTTARREHKKRFPQNEMKTINLISPFMSSRQYSRGVLIKSHLYAISSKGAISQRKKEKKEEQKKGNWKVERKASQITNHFSTITTLNCFFTGYKFVEATNSSAKRQHTIRGIKLQIPREDLTKEKEATNSSST